MPSDPQLLWLASGILAILVIASLIGFALSRTAKTDAARATIANLNARTRAWWLMVAIFGGALALGPLAFTILFGLLSFLGLREFITLTPTKPGDHRALFWAFFVITPAHYYLIASNWPGLFMVFIPVYAFLFLPLRTALAGDTENFLERTAKAQWGLMICVYRLSHTPALLLLNIPGYENQNAKLVLFLVIVVQMSDVLQYVWGKTLGRHKVAPLVSPSKTWEGLIGGVLSATGLGAGLWWMTPFTPPQAAALAFVITLCGFAGGLVMSAIKRDCGVKDYGTLIEGHGGVMDRVDSICFSAPIFFHLVRYFWNA